MCFKHDSQAFISSSNPLKWQHKYKSLTDHPELVFKHQGCNQLLGIITRPGCMITDGYALLTQKLMHDPSDFMKFSRKSLKLCNKNLSNLSLLLTKNFLLTMVFCYKNWPDQLWEKFVLVIEKNFWNLRLKTENLQKNLSH